MFFFFFKQKTAYEMRIRDWSSDVCSSDLLPGSTEVPEIKIAHMCTPAEHTEYGMKGMGEGGAISPPAAIANAVRDALAGLGAELCETPITPRRVLQAIHIAENRNGVSGGES